jgi:hypothetical protein
MALAFIPLLGLTVILANLCMFVFNIPFEYTLFSATLPSGGVLALSVGDGFIVLSLFLLYFEIWKAGRPKASAVDHALSLVLFIICLVQVLMAAKAAHSAFVILTLITFLDVIAGFTVSMGTARRDIGVLPS